MTAPVWLTYVGAITGILGALTGIVGLFIGIISYRRVSKLKALDLRVELRRAEVDTAEALTQLPPLLMQANASRFEVAAAMGTVNGGGMESWKDQFRSDLAAVQAMQSAFKPSGEYGALTAAALENKLIEIHRLQSTVLRYTTKYQAALTADDKDREHIRADNRERVSRLSRGGA